MQARYALSYLRAQSLVLFTSSARGSVAISYVLEITGMALCYSTFPAGGLHAGHGLSAPLSPTRARRARHLSTRRARAAVRLEHRHGGAAVHRYTQASELGPRGCL